MNLFYSKHDEHTDSKEVCRNARTPSETRRYPSDLSAVSLSLAYGDKLERCQDIAQPVEDWLWFHGPTSLLRRVVRQTLLPRQVRAVASLTRIGANSRGC